MSTHPLGKFGIAVAVLLLAACATVPITGRTRLNMISEQQLALTANLEFAKFMTMVNQKNAVLPRSESPQASAMLDLVARVSDRVIEGADLKGKYDWQTVVVKSRQASAFVMPNGKIIVFTGLLPVTETEAGLAAVIGHEVGHVVARHAAERISQVLLVQMTLAAANAVLAASNSKYRPVITAGLGLGALYGVLRPFSRAHESEADHLGLFFMARAGYDPAGAIGVWERMEARVGAGPWEFLSTHPSHETRRAQIREWLPEANRYYADRTRSLPTTLAEVKTAREDLDRRPQSSPIITAPASRPTAVKEAALQAARPAEVSPPLPPVAARQPTAPESLARPLGTPGRPISGTILSRRGVGRGLGEIALSNMLDRDTVVTFLAIAPVSGPYLTVYVRAREFAVIKDIAEGEYQLTYIVGDDWTGQEFARAGATFRLNSPLKFEDSYIVVRGSGGETTRRMPGEPWHVVLGSTSTEPGKAREGGDTPGPKRK